MERFNISSEFSACIRSIGGVDLDEELPGQRGYFNADYWLPRRNVIVELKCLERSYFSSKSFDERLQNFYLGWVRKRRIKPVPLGHKIKLEDVPRDCAEEVVEFVKNKLQDSTIKHANKQIRHIQRLKNAPDAKGLLVLGSDGNYGLPPGMVRTVLIGLTETKLRAINSVVFFTPNELVSMPGAESTRLWCDWSFKSRPSVSKECLEAVRDAWFAHVSRVSGLPVVASEFTSKGDGDDPLLNTKFVNWNP